MRINTEPQPAFPDRQFDVILSGLELAHIWKLSTMKEALPFPGVSSGNRLYQRIERALGVNDLPELALLGDSTDFSKAYG